MSKPVEIHPPKRNTSQLEQWLYRTIVSKGLKVQYRLRGNTLHLLCRSNPAPNREKTLVWLLPVLQKTNFSDLLSAADPRVYQVWLYGCEPNDKRPRWTVPLYLNQLDRHLEQLQASLATPVVESVAAGATSRATSRASGVATATLANGPQPRDNAAGISALALSNVALARRGEEMAIACYLSETLNELGVAVRVSAKVIPYKPPAAVQLKPDAVPLTAKRLWVACEASYSPDPALLSEPITHKLRQLEVEGFHDAVILFQVAGEPKPDWALRVDLTPPTEMLREWARWGDLEAIQRLLNQDLASLHLQITTATLNATTLHLFCSSCPTSAPNLVVEHHKRAKADVALLLEAIGPQGIHAATLYGQLPQQDAPMWVEWLDLPAAQHPAFAESALTLAKQADWEAIAFLLHRLLNPDLDQYLNTGGIRLQLLPKQDLLHVMSEASRCPDRRQVASVVVRFLRQLELPGISGVRIYGRRAGQKKPYWSYGLDFVSRSRLVPEVTPEFAATDAFVTDLLPEPGQAVLRPDLTPADLQQAWTSWQQRLRQKVQQKVQRVLLRSQCFTFIPHAESEVNALPGESSAYSRKVVLVWGAAGLLLLLQSNWILSQILHSPALQSRSPSAPVTVAMPQVTPASPTTLPSPTALPRANEETSAKSSTQETTAEQPVFNTSSFTRSESAEPADEPAVQSTAQTSQPSSLPYTPRNQSATLVTAEILSEGSPLPTFNSHQLDEKLLLYYRYLEKFGPPDVLIVGSSRALRGVDPLALQAALTDLGYADAQVFNFGINGATAQVIQVLVQQILAPEQLPRLILWADGARAFNSGTDDVTYNGIVASAAYQQLLAGTLPIPRQTDEPIAAPIQQPSINDSLITSYQSIDRWFSEKLGSISGTHPERDRLKSWLQQGMARLLPSPSEPLPTDLEPSQPGTQPVKSLQANQPLPDETGFLSLAMQFNPATYYQQYARVLGAYDSDYEDFQISGSQEKALQSLLQFTEASQIPLVFVNLPLTEDYLDPVRLEYEQEFRDYMVQLSLNQPGFVFRDLSKRWITQYRYFSDPSHLNRYGAHAVSVNLAQDVKIPWSQSTRSAAQQVLEDRQARVD